MAEVAGAGSLPSFDATEYRRRWAGLQEALQARDLAAAVLSQSRNVLYYAGMAVHGHVVVPAAAAPVLLVQIDGRRARALSPVPRVVDSRGMTTLVETLHELGCHDGTIGVEEEFLSVAAHRKLRTRLPGAELVDVGTDVLALRARKSPAEIDVLRRAAAVSDAQFALVRERARAGVSEIELHADLGRLQRQLGADGVSAKRSSNDRFIDHAWVVSGPNTEQVSGYWLTMTGAGPSPARPYGPTSRALQHGDILCCDIGTAYHGYHVDHARSYVVGPPHDRHLRVWDALLEMQEQAVEVAVPGRTASEVYDAARRVAEARGLADVFMTRAVTDFPYVGHGVGVEIDEGPLLSPTDRTVLQEGMVLAVEPKVIIPGWGGMTLEDAVVVRREGAERLTGGGTDLRLGD